MIREMTSFAHKLPRVIIQRKDVQKVFAALWIAIGVPQPTLDQDFNKTKPGKLYSQIARRYRCALGRADHQEPPHDQTMNALGLEYGECSSTGLSFLQKKSLLKTMTSSSLPLPYHSQCLE